MCHCADISRCRVLLNAVKVVLKTAFRTQSEPDYSWIETPGHQFLGFVTVYTSKKGDSMTAFLVDSFLILQKQFQDNSDPTTTESGREGGGWWLAAHIKDTTKLYSTKVDSYFPALDVIEYDMVW